jgi:hypothetical protein
MSSTSNRTPATILATSAIVCGLGGFAGVYPRFADAPSIRLVMAMSCALLGPYVISLALRADNARVAALRALGLSIIAGIVATIAPSFLIMVHAGSAAVFAVCLAFGIAAGGQTGAVYGIFLAVLAWCAHPRVSSEAPTRRRTLRLARLASAWAIAPLLLVTYCTLSDDPNAEHSGMFTHLTADHALEKATGSLGVAINAACVSAAVASIVVTIIASVWLDQLKES